MMQTNKRSPFILSCYGILFCILILLGLFSNVHSGRFGGGGGGFRSSGSFGGSRSSFGSSSSSGSSFGSSSGSRSFGSSGGSGSRPVSSPSASSSGNRFGSSSSSGGTSAAGGSRMSPGASSGAVGAGAGGARRFGSSAPSGTGISGTRNYGAAGTSASRSSYSRPQANPPAPARNTPSAQPVYNSHTTIINNHGGGAFGGGGFGTGSLLLAGAGGMVGGYLLGHALASSMYSSHGCCYGCGCNYYGPPPPWYYDSYVPYRYRYATETSTTTAAPSSGGTTTTAAPAKPVDICTLARWNMELPFTELPNMILTFISTDNISGDSIPAKGKFLYEFLNTTAEPYGSLPAQSNVFQIDKSFNLNQCNFNLPKRKKESSVPSQISDGGNGTLISNVTDLTTSSPNAPTTSRPWYAGGPMEMWRNKVRGGDRMPCITFSFADIPECGAPTSSGPEEPFLTAVRRLTDLYSNASSDSNMLTELVASAKRCYPKDLTPPAEIIPCLDYSIDSKQVSSLQNLASIFGNEEICSKYLNPDLPKCLKSGSTFPCTAIDMTNLNVFARNYYLCKEPVDPQLIAKMQNQQSGQLSADAVPGNTIPQISSTGQNFGSEASGTKNIGTNILPEAFFIFSALFVILLSR